MVAVGAFEAKTHLSRLLDRVAQGEHVIITRRGKPVAKLVPFEQAKQADYRAIVERLKELRKNTRLDGLSWKDLRDEGRR